MQSASSSSVSSVAVWPTVQPNPSAASYVDRAATDAGTVADMTATRKTEKYLTLSSAYRFEPIAVESWRLQFHNSELYFRTRPPNLCSRRRCERDFILIPTHFYHATMLQLRAFARHSASWPARPMTIWNFDFSFFSFLTPLSSPLDFCTSARAVVQK